MSEVKKDKTKKELKEKVMTAKGNAILILVILITMCTLLCSCEENQDLECGETAFTEYIDITIDNPVKTLIQKTGDDTYDALLKVPIKLEAHDEVTVEAADFNSQVLEKKKCFPKSLSLNDGDSYEGFLFINWPSASIENGASPITEVSGEKYSYSCTWHFNYEADLKKSNNTRKIQKLLPNTPVKVKGTILSISYSPQIEEYIATFKCAKKGKLFFSVPEGDFSEYEKYAKDSGNGRKVTIEGSIGNVITSDSEGKEYKRPFLENVNIVKVHKSKKNKNKKKRKESRKAPTESVVRNEIMVYVTPSGKKYHNGWCRYAKGSGVKTITLQKALDKGLGACGICH